jgi:hypothetical protein
MYCVFGFSKLHNVNVEAVSRKIGQFFWPCYVRPEYLGSCTLSSLLTGLVYIPLAWLSSLSFLYLVLTTLFGSCNSGFSVLW